MQLILVWFGHMSRGGATEWGIIMGLGRLFEVSDVAVLGKWGNSGPGPYNMNDLTGVADICIWPGYSWHIHSFLPLPLLSAKHSAV